MYEIADIVSLSLGLFSIIGSLYIGVRPLILNASIGSASWGTYNIFIIAWLVADCLNVTGSFVSSQLPFQMMYSCLQLVLTLIFIGQCFHYADKPSLTALSAYVPLDLSRKLHLLQIYPIVQYLGLDSDETEQVHREYIALEHASGRGGSGNHIHDDSLDSDDGELMMGNGNSFRNRNKESNGYGSLEREEDENPYDDDEDELYTSHSIHAGHSTDTDANTVPGYSRGNENNVAFTPSSSVDMVYRTLRGIGCCFGTCIFIFIFICLFSYLSSHIDTSISSPIRHYNPHHSFVNHNDGGGSYSYSYSDSDSDRFDGTGADDAVAHTRSNRLHHNHNDNRADVGSGSTVRADEMSAIDFENAIGWLMLLLYFCVRCRTFFYLCKHEVLGLKYRRYILEMICLSCYVFAVLLRCHPGHTQPTTLNALSPSSAPISLSSSLGYPVYTTTGRTMYGDDDNHASYGYNDDTDADIDVSGPGEGEGEGLPFTSEQTPRLPSPFSRHFSRHLPWIFDALLAMLFNAFVLCRFLFHKYCDSSEERGRLIKVGSLHSVVMSEFNDHEHKVSIHDHRRKHSDQYGGGRTRAYDSDSSNDEEYRVDFSPIHFSQSPIQRGGRGEPPPPHMHMHMHTHGGNGTTSLDSSMHSTASGMGGRPLVGPSLDDSGLLYSSGNHPTTSSANDSFVGFSRM